MKDATFLPDLAAKWPERLARVRSVPPTEGLVRPSRDAAKQALLEEMGQLGPYVPRSIVKDPNPGRPKAPAVPAGETPSDMAP